MKIGFSTTFMHFISKSQGKDAKHVLQVVHFHMWIFTCEISNVKLFVFSCKK